MLLQGGERDQHSMRLAGQAEDTQGRERTCPQNKVAAWLADLLWNPLIHWVVARPSLSQTVFRDSVRTAQYTLRIFQKHHQVIKVSFIHQLMH